MECDKSVKLDKHLKVGYGSNLMLRSVVWEAPKRSYTNGYNLSLSSQID